MNERMYNLALDALYDSSVTADIEKKLITHGLDSKQAQDRIPISKALHIIAEKYPEEFKAALKTFIKNGR